MSEKEQLNRVTESIIGAAIQVHRALGPGLLESAYGACLAFDLLEVGHTVERQKSKMIFLCALSVLCGEKSVG
jgi:GxxExxY protein